MDEQGIKFNFVSREEACEILKDSNYYRLPVYKTNFEKYGPNSKKAGKYIDLDFGHLMVLTDIDRYVRFLVFQMSTDIENNLKGKLLNTIINDPNEDGYHIVEAFLRDEDSSGKIRKRIKVLRLSSYCKDLVKAYSQNFPIRVLIELITFGDLIHLITYYDRCYGTNILGFVHNKFINTVRDFRNWSAHGNCLLNNVTKQHFKRQDTRIVEFVKVNTVNPPHFFIKFSEIFEKRFFL